MKAARGRAAAAPRTGRALAGAALVAVLVLATLVVQAPPAGACSCAPVTDEEAFAQAEAVFTASLVEVIAPAVLTGTDPVRFVFDVDDVLKGDVRPLQTIVTYDGSATCGLALSGPGPLLVFAASASPPELHAADGELFSSLCSGSRRLAEGEAAAELAQRLRGPDGAGSEAASDDEDAGGVSTALLVGAAGGAAVVVAAALVWRRHRATRPA